MRESQDASRRDEALRAWNAANSHGDDLDVEAFLRGWDARSLAPDSDSAALAPADPDATRIECWRTSDRDELVYRLTIRDEDVRRTRLLEVDRKLLAECESTDATVADRLLGLELLVRRIEEARDA